jgi:hypothetical protein
MDAFHSRSAKEETESNLAQSLIESEKRKDRLLNEYDKKEENASEQLDSIMQNEIDEDRQTISSRNSHRLH